MTTTNPRSQVICLWAAVLVLFCVSSSFGGEVRGRVVYASKGVAKATIRLVEPWAGIKWAVPQGPESTSAADGSFSFAGVSTPKEYVLVVFDPFTNGRVVTVGVTPRPGTQDVGVINLMKKLDFATPKDLAYLPPGKVSVRWSALPEAALYKLEITRTGSERKRVVESKTNQLQLDLTPGAYYGLDVQAFDSQGLMIGAQIMNWTGVGGGPLWFGIADPMAESRLEPALNGATCLLRGKPVNLYIKPTAQRGRSSPAAAPFLVEADNEVRVIGKAADWRKVQLVTGYFPGTIAWAHESDLSCR